MNDDDADASGARPGEGALRFSHSGYRYLLGYGSDFFGIWDREEPGGPILRFPRTDEGWDEAWYEYVSREKHNVELLAPELAYKPTRVRGAWTRGLLYLHVVGAFAVVVMLTYDLTQLAQVSRGLLVDVHEAGQRISGMFGLLLFLGFYPAPAAIAWLLWQYRAHQNVVALGTSGLSYTPGWSVAWWFVPFAMFVMPYRLVRELWDRERSECDRRRMEANPDAQSLTSVVGVVAQLSCPFHRRSAGRPGRRHPQADNGSWVRHHRGARDRVCRHSRYPRGSSDRRSPGAEARRGGSFARIHDPAPPLSR